MNKDSVGREGGGGRGEFAYFEHAI